MAFYKNSEKCNNIHFSFILYKKKENSKETGILFLFFHPSIVSAYTEHNRSSVYDPDGFPNLLCDRKQFNISSCSDRFQLDPGIVFIPMISDNGRLILFLSLPNRGDRL